MKSQDFECLAVLGVFFFWGGRITWDFEFLMTFLEIGYLVVTSPSLFVNQVLYRLKNIPLD